MPEALPLQPGDPRRLGEHEITGRIGVGEHGAVFLGRSADGRPVAVKLLHLGLSGRPLADARFTAAFAAARRVAGFCSASVLDAGTQDDRAFVVTEFVDGPSLAALVAAEGPRGDTVLERLAVGMAVALAAIHRAGSVHGDLRPANVLLGPDGPRVTDIAVRSALEALGTPPSTTGEAPYYQAPEQFEGGPAGAPADIFAWGATLLFAATGVRPFSDMAPDEDPDLAPLPESLRGLVGTALARDPADRPTAQRILDRLLVEDAALADRLPASMVAEGRALAQGVRAPQPAPGPGPDEQATTLFSAPTPDTEGTALIPGLADPGTAVLPPVPPAPKARRGGHVLGLALSVTIGVLAGVAIITLVLWPRLGGGDGGSGGDPANVADGRPVAAIPGTFAGTWKGTAVNQNSGVSFPVEVTFQEGGKTAHAVYPKERCNGTLSLTRGTGSSLEMALRIGKPCTPGHIQVTRQPDGTLQYAWSRSENGRPVGYQGRLTRIG
ncbi:serine/threonine-protein kinase [Actinomadura rayongensis]|uniref:Protein kinase n=1 Tax=Actinomadura rayongensis TaxID=1429076 RepID=A0A6I4WBA8_9ACTN|nr:serine/threonine-protein kinase [Actinomadura rayongensis]MXQ66841.1 protein kinase [Actinomadura rayongensis]